MKFFLKKLELLQFWFSFEFRFSWIIKSFDSLETHASVPKKILDVPRNFLEPKNHYFRTIFVEKFGVPQKKIGQSVLRHQKSWPPLDSRGVMTNLCEPPNIMWSKKKRFIIFSNSIQPNFNLSLIKVSKNTSLHKNSCDPMNLLETCNT